jgi:hypothetical protein
VRGAVPQGAEHEAADSAEAIDADLHGCNNPPKGAWTSQA